MKVIVTGSAGFIGFHLSKLMLDLGYIVLVLVLTNYDPNLKRARLSILEQNPNYKHFSNRIENVSKFRIYLKNKSRLCSAFGRTSRRSIFDRGARRIRENKFGRFF